MEDKNELAATGESDLCLTMVELALAQNNLEHGRSESEVPGSHYVDLSPQNASECGPSVFGLDIDTLGVPADLISTLPPVTYPLSYVTQEDPGPHAAFDHFTPLHFDLDTCLSERTFATAQASTDPPLPSISGASSSSDDYSGLLLDYGAMPSQGMSCDTTANKIGRRKKLIPRRHSQPPPNRPLPDNTVGLPPTVPSPENPADDFARLVNYVPACLAKFGFCVVDRFAGKNLGSSVRSEVLAMYEKGSFEDGLLTNQAFAVIELFIYLFVALRPHLIHHYLLVVGHAKLCR